MSISALSTGDRNILSVKKSYKEIITVQCAK